jgi:cytochrome c oxidase cbb3-type subunit 4
MSEETLGILRGLATLGAMLAFIGVCLWAWSRRRTGDFERAAQLPLEEDSLKDSKS